MGQAERLTVIPPANVINVMSLFATVGCTIVLPLATEIYLWLSRMVLGGAYVLIVFYPFTVAAHYQLWKRESESSKATQATSTRYANREELAISIICVVMAPVVAAYFGAFECRQRRERGR